MCGYVHVPAEDGGSGRTEVTGGCGPPHIGAGNRTPVPSSLLICLFFSRVHPHWMRSVYSHQCAASQMKNLPGVQVCKPHRLRGGNPPFPTSSTGQGPANRKQKVAMAAGVMTSRRRRRQGAGTRAERAGRRGGRAVSGIQAWQGLCARPAGSARTRVGSRAGPHSAPSM